MESIRSNVVLVVPNASRRFRQEWQHVDTKNIIIIANVFGKAIPLLLLLPLITRFPRLSSCCKCNVVIPDGHNFVDMLDGRYQCLNCSKHIVGFYQGKEHAPHAENMFGQIILVQCDQAGRIPICDKCTRPVPTGEEAFQHETRYYHLDCARCNRCRKKLFQVPCRKLGSALGKILLS